MIKCDIGSTYGNYWTINCKEKKKKKGTTECDKSMVKSNVGTA